MTPVRVGVVLCTHNGARYVAAQARSIVEQTLPASEIVLSDDASADGTVGVARSVLESSQLGVTVLENRPALGVTANFEQGLRASGGQVIALSDQDDVWHPGKLQTMVGELERSGALLAWSDARLVDGDGAPLGRTLFQDLEVSSAEIESVRSGDAFPALLRRNLATGATVVLDRSLLDVALPIPAEWVHDEWLAVVAAAVGRVSVVTEPTIDYRLHGGNQIGVTAPTLAYKVRRVLEARGDRNAVLASKFTVLAQRMASLADVVGADVVRATEQKARFERAREALPASRWLRVAPVLRLHRRGAYRRFASRGLFDIARDLLQSHREPSPS
ncbi:glycosyltransferase [Leifsonia sp. AG29]|uniref:glycosyltransferase n=1 Tax=Leifsonia sp. AG29 TaxID=2598860 RepID=UPI00131C29D7|nr:glycosyltransferase [Leifsonia sp. AG29]